MDKKKFKIRRVCKLMIICGLLFCTSLQVQAEPSRPGRAEQKIDLSGGFLAVLGVAAASAVGGFLLVKKSSVQGKKAAAVQSEVQTSELHISNQNTYNYSELEPTVAMEATVGWDHGGMNEKQFCVEVINGVYEGRKYRLTGLSTMIGRVEEANIRYPADARGISRRHCQILRDANGLMLMDMGSSWGTFIVGKGKIPANQPVAVSEGDMIYLGSEDNTLVIHVEV